MRARATEPAHIQIPRQRIAQGIIVIHDGDGYIRAGAGIGHAPFCIIRRNGTIRQKEDKLYLRGTVKTNRAPCPGWVWRAKWPLMLARRSCMLVRPLPVRPTDAGTATAKPRPLSVTVTSKAAGR